MQDWWEVQGNGAFEAGDCAPSPCVAEEQGSKIRVSFIGAEP